MRLINADLYVLGREEQVNSLGLVTVVLVVSDRLLLLTWDIIPDSGRPEGTVNITLLPDNIPRANLRAYSKISIWLQLSIAWFTL